MCFIAYAAVVVGRWATIHENPGGKTYFSVDLPHFPQEPLYDHHLDSWYKAQLIELTETLLRKLEIMLNGC